MDSFWKFVGIIALCVTLLVASKVYVILQQSEKTVSNLSKVNWNPVVVLHLVNKENGLVSVYTEELMNSDGDLRIIYMGTMLKSEVNFKIPAGVLIEVK